MTPMQKFCLGMVFSIFLFHVLTYKYLNPYKLTIIFGKKGSGKTTLAVKLAQKALRKGRPVYTNFYCPGCRLFNPEDINTHTFPKKAVIIADEGSLIWNNRRWKSFLAGVEEYFRYQRQYENRFYILSQSFDIDLKLRTLCDEMFLCKNVLRVFSWAKRIKKDIMLTAPDGEFEARIADTLEFQPLLMWPFGSRILTFIPRWSKYFKSFNPPPRDLIPYSQMDPYAKVPLLGKLRNALDQRKENGAVELHDDEVDPPSDPPSP